MKELKSNSVDYPCDGCRLMDNNGVCHSKKPDFEGPISCGGPFKIRKGSLFIDKYYSCHGNNGHGKCSLRGIEALSEFDCDSCGLYERVASQRHFYFNNGKLIERLRKRSGIESRSMGLLMSWNIPAEIVEKWETGELELSLAFLVEILNLLSHVVYPWERSLSTMTCESTVSYDADSDIRKALPCSHEMSLPEKDCKCKYCMAECPEHLEVDMDPPVVLENNLSMRKETHDFYSNMMPDGNQLLISRLELDITRKVLARDINKMLVSGSVSSWDIKDWESGAQVPVRAGLELLKSLYIDIPKSLSGSDASKCLLLIGVKLKEKRQSLDIEIETLCKMMGSLNVKTEYIENIENGEIDILDEKIFRWMVSIYYPAISENDMIKITTLFYAYKYSSQ